MDQETTGDSYLHHTAIQVNDIISSINFYEDMFNVKVLYQDNTWALLDCGGSKLSLVIEGEHPQHIAFVTPLAQEYQKNMQGHRDGTVSCYVKDPSGNILELIDPRTISKAYA